MNYEAYIKLEQAIKNNELASFLLAKPGYWLSSYQDPSFPMNNDYRTLVVALNDYGKEHVGFDKNLHYTVLDCLNLETPGAAYNITQIIRHQLFLDDHGKNSISFIDEDVQLHLGSEKGSCKEALSGGLPVYEIDGNVYKMREGTINSLDLSKVIDWDKVDLTIDNFSPETGELISRYKLKVINGKTCLVLQGG